MSAALNRDIVKNASRVLGQQRGKKKRESWRRLLLAGKKNGNEREGRES